jgi:hypothetical protein
LIAAGSVVVAKAVFFGFVGRFVWVLILGFALAFAVTIVG